MYNAFADKLIEITERHTDKMSRRWCESVRTNPRTPSYHSKTPDQCILHAVDFYKNLRRIYFSAKPYTEVNKFFTRYAEESFREGTPLHEAAYALIMMRRHMWLFADFQAMFVTPLDNQQAVETINKTIRLFDHGLYILIQKYGELNQQG